MTIDDKRFLARHLPSFVTFTSTRLEGEVQKVLQATRVLAVRSDGVAFYVPKAHRTEVWVGWLGRTSDGLELKATPATRRLCTETEFHADMDERLSKARRLLGEEVQA